MPSGAKKRKKAAAAKKKEEEEQVGSISHPPPSTNPLPPQQDKELEQKGEMESSESSKEESPSSEIPVSEAKDVSIEVAHSKEEEEEEEEVSSGSQRFSEVKDASDEFVETKEKVGGGSNLGVKSTKPSEEHFSEVPVSVPADSALSEGAESREMPSGLGGDASVAARSTEIVLQRDPVPIAPASEVVVEATEVPVSLSADSGLSEGEESREMPNMGTVIETSVADAHATGPLLEHPASLWNCCGLLDFFKGSALKDDVSSARIHGDRFGEEMHA